MNVLARASCPWLLAGSTALAAGLPSPPEFLGIQVGADRVLADYRQIASYFKALGAASPRVEVEVLGKTTLGEDMFMAVISSESNIKNQKRIREIARRLADPRGLFRGRRAYPDEARDVLLSGWIRGKDRLVRRAAAVATTYGNGKLVLLGFRAQHRAQTPGTFPFLFNALYW